MSASICPMQAEPPGYSPAIAPVCSVTPVWSQVPRTARCVTCTNGQHDLTLQHTAATCHARPTLGQGARTSMGSVSRQTRS